MMDDVGAADRWYEGMAKAALERKVAIQYCLPSATDMLISLSLPAVVQARASGDYARPLGSDDKPWGNVVTLGGASLLMGATKMAPSKDTLWTKSPQPGTASDRIPSNKYVSQPHVQLDSALAVMSLGPVGISDGLSQTDAKMISQGFRSAKDSTLLRPSRPLSTVDSVFANHSRAEAQIQEWRYNIKSTTDGPPPAPTGNDIRATHAALSGGGPNSHYVLAWMLKEQVTLQSTDLYPAPPKDAKLATRQHICTADAKPADQAKGCVDGQPATSCIAVLAAGQMPSIEPTHAAAGTRRQM